MIELQPNLLPLPPHLHPHCPVVRSPRVPRGQLFRPSSLSSLDLYWPAGSNTIHNNRQRKPVCVCHQQWSDTERWLPWPPSGCSRLSAIHHRPPAHQDTHTHLKHILSVPKLPPVSCAETEMTLRNVYISTRLLSRPLNADFSVLCYVLL